MVDILKTCQRQDRSDLTEAQLRDIARNFDAWYVHDTPVEGIRHAYSIILRDENPNMLLGFYMHATSDRWISDLNPQNKDYYYLKDVSGNYVTFRSGKVLDIGHPEVQLAWTNAAKRRFDRWNYDFVMADIFIVDINRIKRWTTNKAHPINPRTGQLYTYDEWLNDMTEYYQTIKSVIGDKKVIANVGWAYVYSSHGTDLPIYRQLDGILFEDYSERSVASIELVLVALTRQRRDENVFIYWANRIYSDIYRLCFYLLNAHDKSIITIRGNEGFPNQYKGKIGNPIGEYYKISGVYIRRYEKALILFNPSGAQTITIDGNEVVVGASTGKIILTEQIPPPIPLWKILIGVSSVFGASAGAVIMYKPKEGVK